MGRSLVLTSWWQPKKDPKASAPQIQGITGTHGKITTFTLPRPGDETSRIHFNSIAFYKGRWSFSLYSLNCQWLARKVPWIPLIPLIILIPLGKISLDTIRLFKKNLAEYQTPRTIINGISHYTEAISLRPINAKVIADKNIFSSWQLPRRKADKEGGSSTAKPTDELYRLLGSNCCELQFTISNTWAGTTIKPDSIADAEETPQPWHTDPERQLLSALFICGDRDQSPHASPWSHISVTTKTETS